MPHQASQSELVAHHERARYESDHTDRDQDGLSVDFRALLSQGLRAASIEPDAQSVGSLPAEGGTSDDAAHSNHSNLATNVGGRVMLNLIQAKARRASISIFPITAPTSPSLAPSSTSGDGDGDGNGDTPPRKVVFKVPQPGDPGFNLTQEMHKMQKSFFILDETPAEDVMGYWPATQEEKTRDIRGLKVWATNPATLDKSEENAEKERLATLAKLESRMGYAEKYSREPVPPEVMAQERISQLPPHLRSMPAVNDSEDWYDDDDWESVDEDGEDNEAALESEVSSLLDHRLSALSLSPSALLGLIDTSIIPSLELAAQASGGQAGLGSVMHHASNINGAHGLGIVVPQSSYEPDQVPVYSDDDLASSPGSAFSEPSHDDEVFSSSPQHEYQTSQSNVIGDPFPRPETAEPEAKIEEEEGLEITPTQASQETQRASSFPIDPLAASKTPTAESVKELEKLLRRRRILIEIKQNERDEGHLLRLRKEHELAFAECDAGSLEGHARQDMDLKVDSLRTQIKALREKDEMYRKRIDYLTARMKSAEDTFEQKKKQSMLVERTKEMGELAKNIVRTEPTEGEMKMKAEIKKGNKEDPEKKKLAAQLGLLRGRGHSKD